MWFTHIITSIFSKSRIVFNRLLLVYTFSFNLQEGWIFQNINIQHILPEHYSKPLSQISVNAIPSLWRIMTEQDDGGVGGHGALLHGYIRNTPSDTEVHAEHQPRVDRSTWPISSVQFSRSVMSDSLRPHEPQHARTPCPSPTPKVQPNPCPLSQWSHPTILSSVIPFPYYPQPFAA